MPSQYTVQFDSSSAPAVTEEVEEATATATIEEATAKDKEANANRSNNKEQLVNSSYNEFAKN